MPSYDRTKIRKHVVAAGTPGQRVYLTSEGRWTQSLAEAGFRKPRESRAIVLMYVQQGYEVVTLAYLDALAETWSGCVRLWKPQEGDVVVGLYRGEEAGMDTDGGKAPWSLVCEDHSHVVHFETRAIAEHHGVKPLGWCDVCSGAEKYRD